MLLKYIQNKFIQLKHYFLKLTSVSHCQNCGQEITEITEISDLPIISQLHSPNPEEENLIEPAPIIESFGTRTFHPIFSPSHLVQQFHLMDDDQAN